MNNLLLFVLFISLIVALVTPTALGQEIVVPSWIKNNAGWWASDQIPDSAFPSRHTISNQGGNHDYTVH